MSNVIVGNFQVVPLTDEQKALKDDVIFDLQEGRITRDEANEQIAAIDPDWWRR